MYQNLLEPFGKLLIVLEALIVSILYFRSNKHRHNQNNQTGNYPSHGSYCKHSTPPFEKQRQLTILLRHIQSSNDNLHLGPITSVSRTLHTDSRLGRNSNRATQRSFTLADVSTLQRL